MTESNTWAGLEGQLKDEREKVDVASTDFSTRELVRMLTEGELSITPEYQRQYRWSRETASTFIESVFLGLPVPPIFVATNEGFQLEVVDGLQRLSTLLYYMSDDENTVKGVSEDGKPLALRGLQKLTQLNDVTFATLPKSLQWYFGRQPLQVISLTDKSDLGVRFDLFERLNAGSLVLSAQEVRACVYRGDFNQFIERLASKKSFQFLLKLQSANRKDGTAAEEVLKFFAYKNTLDGFDGRVKLYLNKYMGASRDRGRAFPFRLEEDLFDQAVEHLLQATGGTPFVRASTRVTPLVQFEACLVGIALLLSEGIDVSIPALGWIEDKTLVDASTGATNTRRNLNARVNRAKELFSGAS